MLIAILALVGILLAVAFLIIGLFDNRRLAIKRAGLTFLPTALIVIIATFTEGSFSDEPKEDRKVILVASREAPLGGISLTLYEDSTFELSNLRNTYSTGTFRIKRDTLQIIAKDTTKLMTGVRETSFLINKGSLLEIINTGIVVLEIHVIKLK